MNMRQLHILFNSSKLILLDFLKVLKGNKVQLTYVHTVFVSSCCQVEKMPLKKGWACT